MALGVVHLFESGSPCKIKLQLFVQSYTKICLVSQPNSYSNPQFIILSKSMWNTFFLLDDWAWCHVLFSDSDWLPGPLQVLFLLEIVNHTKIHQVIEFQQKVDLEMFALQE